MTSVESPAESIRAKMNDCIFCKIIKGEVQSSKVYENKDIIAFLDISPVNKGHTLIVTKGHYETLTDIPNDILKKMIIAVKEIANAVYKAMNADGYNLEMNNYRAAGQLVYHAHIHIIPRFKQDGLRHWPGHSYEEGESDIIAEKIKSFLKKSLIS